MQTLIIGGLAIYGLTVLIVQLSMLFYRSEPQSAVHYVVFTHFSEAKIEWSIRSLTKLSRLSGRNFYFYVIDSGSNDDTLKIIECLERSGIQIQKLTHFPMEMKEKHHHVHVIDLREDCFGCELRIT